MKIRLIESTDEVTIEAVVLDFPRDDESQEVFEERMIRLAGRLLNIRFTLVDEEEGDDECRTS